MNASRSDQEIITHRLQEMGIEARLMEGGRCALADMADKLGKPAEAATWRDRAADIRQRIMEHCYDPEDQCFYDVDADGNFVRIRGDPLTRVLGEHVVGQDLFGIFKRKKVEA